jgi:hypothetical protein
MQDMRPIKQRNISRGWRSGDRVQVFMLGSCGDTREILLKGSFCWS